MIRLTFFEDKKERVRCTDVNNEIQFHLHKNERFENRQYLFRGSDFFFDGYSIFFERDDKIFGSPKMFSFSMCFIPLCASSGGDGLFSCYDDQKMCGIQMVLCKDGTVQVTLGDGMSPISFGSINGRVLWNVRNIVTVVYRGDAGWCDLYINGILSNRKQFARHTKLLYPERKAFLGKRVDHGKWTEKAKSGCFYGFIEWVGFEECVMTDPEVKKLHAAYYSGVEETEAAAAGAPGRDAYVNDRNRPRYHLIAPGKWMNEPHGPFAYDGWYHIFYQANPHAPLWDHIHWGHVVSRDMIHWKDCPLALRPDADGLDADGCWSGSGLIDRNGVPRIYYTAGDDRRCPNQGIAMAVPASAADDRLLVKWKKNETLVQEQNIGWIGEFRDPFVWLEKDTYFMLVGTGDEHNGGGNAALYSSDDGVCWESHGFLVEYDYALNQEVGHVWELPVLLPLRDTSGEIQCHILLLCACQIEDRRPVETYYFLGRWNAEARTFTKFHEQARLLDLGHGTFTGSSGFVTPDRRSVFFTIAQGKRDPDAEFYSGWAHNGGLPLELSVRDNICCYHPVRELYRLRRKKLLESGPVSPQIINEKLKDVHGDSLYLEFVVSGDYAAVELLFDDFCRLVYYDRGKKRFGAKDESGSEIGLWRGVVDDVVIGEEAIHFICCLDGSMLEVYVNGVKSITLRNYSKGDRLFQIDELTGRIDSLELWEMESAY